MSEVEEMERTGAEGWKMLELLYPLSELLRSGLGWRREQYWGLAGSGAIPAMAVRIIIIAETLGGQGRNISAYSDQ